MGIKSAFKGLMDNLNSNNSAVSTAILVCSLT